MTPRCEDPVFGKDQQHLRWARLREKDADGMFAAVRDDVFPFIKTLGQGSEGGAGEEAAEDSAYVQHMKDATFMVPFPRVPRGVVDQLDEIDMSDADTKGDPYEYMLGKTASAGQDGQFRTPRHTIELMVDMRERCRELLADPREPAVRG